MQTAIHFEAVLFKQACLRSVSRGVAVVSAVRTDAWTAAGLS